MSNYWETRTTRNEAKARKIAATYSAELKKLHNQMYKKIKVYLDALQADIDAGKIASRSELWRAKKYIDLINEIREQTGHIATRQARIVEQCLGDVFATTMGRTMADFGHTYDVVSDTLRAQIINREWLGSDFSARVWKNTSALAARLESDMADMILTGRDIHKQLMRDMSVSYHEADRLIVTESAHIYTEASKAAYKECGVTEVEWLAEVDACPVCAELKGNKWPVDSAPQLPQHCYCRCCLLPVVKIGSTKK